MSTCWEILVVDDDRGVHEATQVALGSQIWRGHRFRLTHAYTAHEARLQLEEAESQHYQVALVSATLEDSSAGLDLCRYIRTRWPRSLRIVLRTGDGDHAPQDAAHLREFDVDSYLRREDVSTGQGYNAVRTCLRASQDISTLLAVIHQLQSLTTSLQGLTSLDDLLGLMNEGVNFLEAKYSARVQFVYNLDAAEQANAAGSGAMRPPGLAGTTATIRGAMRAIAMAHFERLEMLQVHFLPDFGFPDNVFVIPFAVDAANEATVRGGVFVEMSEGKPDPKTLDNFLMDARRFLDNWRIAYSVLELQNQISHERTMRETMYLERARSIARLVAGVAHEINTPIGVASTANSMVTTFARQVVDMSPDDPERAPLITDLKDSCALISKNLDRAHRLIKSFRQLSTSELSDDRMSVSLEAVVRDCVETLRPTLLKAGVSASLFRSESLASDGWDGYPGHLSQVILELLQNAADHAYPGTATGEIHIHLDASSIDDVPVFRIRVEDFGEGTDPDILPRIFDAFVTSGGVEGASGLGLAICHNIVTSLLGGTLCVSSENRKGTTFTIEVPMVVPDLEGSTVGRGLPHGAP